MVADVGERSLVVHIGTHKTGTTSFQHALSSATERIESLGKFHIFRSAYTSVRGLALELSLLVVRPSLNFTLRRLLPDSTLESAQAQMRQTVASELSSNAQTVILSQEALSFLRTDREFDDLRSLLTASGRTPHFVVVLRKRESFLRSYKSQLVKMGMPTSSPFTDSLSYTEPDSWLVDTASLIHGYHRAFGADSLTVLSYEAMLQVHGSVIPSLWKACGLPEYLLPAEAHWLNRS